MPQLDLTSFLTQLFWATFILITVFSLISGVIIPEILKGSRLRDKITKELSKNSADKGISTLTNDLPKLIKVLINLDIRKDSQLKSFTNNINQIEINLDNEMNKVKLSNFLTSFKNRRFGLTTIFASLIAPTDEFVLFVSFILFALIFSSALTLTIKNIFDDKIAEFRAKLESLVQIKKQIYKKNQTTIKAAQNISADKSPIVSLVLANLQQQAIIAETQYAKSNLKLNNKTNFENSEKLLNKQILTNLSTYSRNKYLRS
jgi:hypothetical protein